MKRAPGWLALAALITAPAWCQSTESLEREMDRVSKVAGGKVGACAVHVESGRKACVNGSARFPMASTFKVPVAVELLTLVDEGKLKLSQMVDIQPVDLHPGSG